MTASDTTETRRECVLRAQTIFRAKNAACAAKASDFGQALALAPPTAAAHADTPLLTSRGSIRVAGIAVCELVPLCMRKRTESMIGVMFMSHQSFYLWLALMFTLHRCSLSRNPNTSAEHAHAPVLIALQPSPCTCRLVSAWLPPQLACSLTPDPGQARTSSAKVPPCDRANSVFALPRLCSSSGGSAKCLRTFGYACGSRVPRHLSSQAQASDVSG